MAIVSQLGIMGSDPQTDKLTTGDVQALAGLRTAAEVKVPLYVQ